MGAGEKASCSVGNSCRERIPGYVLLPLKLMYANKVGRSRQRRPLCPMQMGRLAAASLRAQLLKMSALSGKKYQDPMSVKEIEGFVKFHGINMQDFDPVDVSQYPTFNAFFSRKLVERAGVALSLRRLQAPGARPIDSPEDASVITSPADARVVAFATVDDATRLWIKGKSFSIRELVGSEELASQFERPGVLISRLAPQDYHRFHFAVGGTILSMTPIEGTLYTVNPIAVNSDVDVFTENRRVITVLETERWGKVIAVTVGATMVGSIVHTVTTGAPSVFTCVTPDAGGTVKKGDEHGFFQFGGSTVIYLFQKGVLLPDSDLSAASSKPIEMYIRMGERVGTMQPPQ